MPVSFLRSSFLITESEETQRKGLLHMKMAEGAKLQMCYLLHHLCDVQLRHRVESIVAFSFDFVGDLQTVRFFQLLFHQFFRY